MAKEKRKPVRASQAFLARELGVAQSTIQRALSGAPGVSEKTRRRIRQFARKHNYRPNVLAQGLFKRRTKTLGVIMGRFSSNHATVFGGIEHEAARHGYTTIMAISNNKIDHEHARVTDMVDRAVDAIIVSSCDPQWEIYEELSNGGKPIVFYGSSADASVGPVLRWDDTHSARLVTEHLLSLGHMRIGFVITQPKHKDQALQGYYVAIRACGMKIDEDLVFRAMPLEQSVPGTDRVSVPENGETAGERLLSIRNRPTAIITEGAGLAAGILNYARKKAILVPESLSVATTGGGYLERYTTPNLTGVNIPFFDMGRLLAGRTVGLLNDPDTPYERISVMRGELVVRDSTAPPQK